MPWVYDSGTTLESLLFSPIRRKVLQGVSEERLICLWSLLTQTKRDTDGELVSVGLFRGRQLLFFPRAHRMRFRENFNGLSVCVCDLR